MPNTALCVDTLRFDTLMIERWRKHGVDYDQEFLKDSTVFEAHEKTNSHVDTSWIKDFFEIFQDEKFRTVVLVVVACLTVVAIVYILKNKFSSPETRVFLSQEEDSIYGVDFDAEIALAEQRLDYFQCIRMRYLKLLRFLQDKGHICWMPGKTVTQYTREVQIEEFRLITIMFVRVRYGNYPATPAFYEESLSLAASVEQALSNEEKKERRMAHE